MSNSNIDQLLQHSDWIRSVAFSLMKDPGKAEDLVQETWLTAIEKPPMVLNNARGWLGQVMRNLARQDARSESRRQHREQVVVGRQVAPSTSELAEKAAMQRELVGDVLALEESLRGIVLLRFFEDLRPKEIAQRLHIPVKTVHSRLARAMEQLRLRLDARYGDRSNWGALLLPLMPTGFGRLATPSKTLAATSATGFVWFVGLFVAVAAALIVAWQFHLLPGQIDEARLAGVGGDANESSALGVGESGLAGPMPSGRSDEVLVTPETAQRAVDERPGPETSGTTDTESTDGGEGPSWVLKGQVVDMDGNGVPYAWLKPFRKFPQPLTIADAAGRFLSEIPGSKRDVDPSLWDRHVIDLEVMSRKWATVRHGFVTPSSFGEEHLVVVAKIGTIHGKVVDAQELGIESASVRLEVPHNSFRGFPHDLTRTKDQWHSVRTQKDGSFSLIGVPVDSRIRLSVNATGHHQQAFPIGEAGSFLELRLKARKEKHTEPTLTGVVFDTNGRPVPGANVQLARSTATTDLDGRFAMDPPLSVSPFGLNRKTPLIAYIEGVQPAMRANFGRDWFLNAGAPMHVLLKMGGQPESMGGQVLSAAGQPCVGWLVKLENETPATDGWGRASRTIEDAVRGDQRQLHTDELGRFEVGGLFSQEYTVRVIDPVSLHRVTAPAKAGDMRVEVIADTDVLNPFAGQVLDLRGNPLEGVLVQLFTITFETIGYSRYFESMPGEQVRTDGEGHFEFAKVPREFVSLEFSGEGLVSRKFEPTGDRAATILMHRRRAVRVDFGPSPRPHHYVQFLDADGEVLTLKSTLVNSSGSQIREEAGLSQLWLVSETACSLRVYWSKRGGGCEYGEPQPFRLEPTGPTTLTL
ncbi:MAG: sigma-70 family RNA polymerase sigma factor [bacterium]|nr:sigma-70 family RNA polymerase sigma factor [bacterium]